MVIFDFDGVIVDSWWLTHKTSKKEYADLTEEEHRAAFEGNIYHEEKGWENRRQDIDYFTEYSKEMHLVQYFDEMEGVVRELAQKHLLSIVSSSTTDVIRKYLDQKDLRGCFADILGADVHKSKHEKIRMFLEKYPLSPSQCVMITDTSGDVREAEIAGVASIGVSWGFHDIERLNKVKTFRIVDKPKEIVTAVKDYFAQ